MIEVWGKGSLRHSVVEVARALEILKLVLCRYSKFERWHFKYGEVPLSGHRVDGVLEIETEDKIKRIGIEVVSKDDDIYKNSEKLKLLIGIGVLDDGLVIKIPMNEVEETIITSSEKIKWVI